MGCGCVRCGFDDARTSCAQLRLNRAKEWSFPPAHRRFVYITHFCDKRDSFLHSGSWLLTGFIWYADASQNRGFPYSTLQNATILSIGAPTSGLGFRAPYLRQPKHETLQGVGSRGSNSAPPPPPQRACLLPDEDLRPGPHKVWGCLWRHQGVLQVTEGKGRY